MRYRLHLISSSFLLLFPAAAHAQSVVDVCTGLRVTLPVLQPVATVASGLLGGLLDPVLNGVVGNVNVNLRNALSGQNIGVNAVDQNGNLITAPGDCGIKGNNLVIEAPGGIAVGAGRIAGLGSSLGVAPVAVDANAIAFGNGASTNAAATAAVAVGLRSAVTAADGVAIGRDARSQGAGGVALGADSLALRSSIALGAGAAATGDSSVAIGAGARATRSGQIAIGGTGSTYTLSGVASAASRANQSGPTQVVTADANGNLATAAIDLPGMDRRITQLGSEIATNRREARRGIASAMAMTAAPMPSAPGRTSWAGSTATFKGEWAAGFAVAHRLPTAVPIAVNAAFSMNGNSFGGARVGVAGEF